MSRFAAYAGLLGALISGREAACDRIERRLLNAKGKAIARTRERQQVAPVLAGCFFDGLPRETAILSERLAAAHVGDGFEPFFERTSPHQLDAAALIVRAYEHWDRSRWPGASGRLAYARLVWGVFVLRHLQDVTLRVWDEGEAEAPERLAEVQRLLGALNATVGDTALVHDARWLVQTAQGPLTKGLAPYFRVAQRIARSFSGEDALEIHAAGAKLAGGHLRSQLRARATELGKTTASTEVRAVTRNSNAMDVALLVWDLVALLEAYTATADHGTRARLADAILQGLSADAELLVTRVDLLAACTFVETVFVHAGPEPPAWTAIGLDHQRVVERYATLLDAASPALIEDARAFDPAVVSYSPLAIEYGFCGDLLSNMATAAVHGRPLHRISLEDLFTTGGDATAKQARAGFAASREWAQDVFARTTDAIEERCRRAGRANASAIPSASLILRCEGESARADAQEYCITSDVNLALATGATAFPRGQIVNDRNEGRYLASVETSGRWFAVSKMVLTERIAAGTDARIAVPQDVADILRLTCPTVCV